MDCLRRVKVIDVPITATNMNEFVNYLARNLDSVKGSYICVSNAHTTVLAHEDPYYYTVQTCSLASIPDGKPLSFIGRKEESNMDRVTGPDLMREIFSSEKFINSTHYFYGNDEEGLEALIRSLRIEYPHLNIVGYEPSLFRKLNEDEKDALYNRINHASPDFLWVGLGAPRQEIFCYESRDKIKSLMIGVGGAFNILSGVTDEAPLWVQNLGMEWFFRFLKEPRRLFKRYFITNNKFIFYCLTKKERVK